MTFELVSNNGASAQLYLNADWASIGNVSTNSAEASKELLAAAAKVALAKGYKQLIAPLNGDTWHSYRTITFNSGEAKFFLEPDSPLSSNVLEDSGFELLAQYSSSKIDLAASQKAISAVIAKRQETINKSFTVRPFNSNNFESELKVIFDLSLLSFKNNFLYQKITFADFAELYKPLSGLIKDDLVWLAFSGSQLVGLLFALPDQYNPQQIILKTVAVHPDYNGLGLASYLLACVHTEAVRLGFNYSVQALYKDENKSANLTSGHSTKLIRSYGLFALNLAATGTLQ